MSVDTQIENALARAQSWGAAANQAASDSLQGIERYPGSAPVTPKPVDYAGTLAVPEDLGTLEHDALQALLQSRLDQFFAVHFSQSDVYDTAVGLVMAGLNGEGVLPGTGFETIWDGAAQYIDAQGNDLTGLDLPAQSMASHATVALEALTHARAHSESALKANLFAHAAAARIGDLRGAALGATSDYLMARLHNDNTVMDSQLAIERARMAMRQTVAAWYETSLGAQRRDVTREYARSSAERTYDMMRNDQQGDTTHAKVAAAIQAAEALSTIATAAASSTNSVISDSTVGF